MAKLFLLVAFACMAATSATFLRTTGCDCTFFTLSSPTSSMQATCPLLYIRSDHEAARYTVRVASAFLTHTHTHTHTQPPGECGQCPEPKVVICGCEKPETARPKMVAKGALSGKCDCAAPEPASDCGCGGAKTVVVPTVTVGTVAGTCGCECSLPSCSCCEAPAPVVKMTPVKATAEPVCGCECGVPTCTCCKPEEKKAPKLVAAGTFSGKCDCTAPAPASDCGCKATQMVHTVTVQAPLKA